MDSDPRQSGIARLFGRERLIWWLLAVSLAIRVAALLYKGVTYDGDGFFDVVGFWNAAGDLLRTGRFTFAGVDPSGRQMPGFVVFLAALRALSSDLWTQYLLAKIAMLALGVGTIYLVYLLGRRTGGVAVGLLAAAMLSISMPHIYTGTLTLSENLFMPLVLGMTLAVIRLADRPDWRWFAACTVLFCAAVYVRQTTLVLLPGVLVYLLLRRYPWRLLLKQSVILGVVFVIAMFPWWVRNYLAYDEFVAFTTYDGAPFFEGTYQVFDPYDNDGLDQMGELLAERGTGYELEDSRLMAEVARERLRERWERDPWGLLFTYLVAKPAAAWALPFYWEEVFGISGYWILRINALSNMLGLILLPVLSFKSRSKHEFALFTLEVAGISLGVIYYLGLSRYVYPFMPMLYIALAYGGVWLCRRVVARRRLVGLKDQQLCTIDPQGSE